MPAKKKDDSQEVSHESLNEDLNEDLNEEANHESLMQAIVDAEKALQEAKYEYKAYCKENPLQAPKQPTNHELRLMREKHNKPTLADHQKANKAAAANAQKEQLKQELKGE